MTTIKAGEILLLAVPESSGFLGKVRPALVLFDTGDADILVARVTGHASVAQALKSLFANW